MSETTSERIRGKAEEMASGYGLDGTTLWHALVDEIEKALFSEREQALREAAEIARKEAEGMDEERCFCSEAILALIEKKGDETQ